MERWFDGTSCALRSCAGAIGEDDAAVVVATDERKRKRLPASTRIAWAANDRQVLHLRCWRDACKGLRGAEKAMVEAAKETLERYDAAGEVRDKARAVAARVRGRTTVAFTGAGISAAAGIPTYRGTSGIDTKSDLNHEEEADDEGTDYSALRPTKAHKALAEICSYVVTQNCDDLHAKAGTPRDALTELHGNVFVEACEQCDAAFARDYAVDAYSTDCHQEPWYVKCKDCGWGHYTGRRCDACGKGKLRDTIINFGDALPYGGLRRAVDRFRGADVCLCLGSSLTVSPANLLPRLVDDLIVVNLQDTDLDSNATIRVFAEADAFLVALQETLAALGEPDPKPKDAEVIVVDDDGDDDNEVIVVEDEKSEARGSSRRRRERAMVLSELEDCVAYSRGVDEERKREATDFEDPLPRKKATKRRRKR